MEPTSVGISQQPSVSSTGISPEIIIIGTSYSSGGGGGNHSHFCFKASVNDILVSVQDIPSQPSGAVIIFIMSLF